MRLSGIVRKVDPLGRIVIPREIRTVLDINEGDSLEILQENNNVVLRKYYVACVFCGSREGISKFNGVGVCEECRKKLVK